MAENIPSIPSGAVPPKKETGKVQPKKETIRAGCLKDSGGVPSGS